ncbi:transcriptional regulator [Pedobacter paludis]|uniref:Transcriptional regulator n=1 Tax=Pedobacter paludis TaxID=2203212 RepID=A0A317F3X9_9SPHI|nr:transcriptional regulator [Pedobacter paludis]
MSNKKHALPPEEYLKKLGERVRSLRVSKGYTNYDKFAYEHDIDRSQWGRFETGKDLRYTSLLQIVSVFDMTLEEFFSEGF